MFERRKHAKTNTREKTLKTFEEVAIEEAEVIDRLFALCEKLLMDLSQYRSIEAEEKNLKELEDKT